MVRTTAEQFGKLYTMHAGIPQAIFRSRDSFDKSLVRCADALAPNPPRRVGTISMMASLDPK